MPGLLLTSQPFKGSVWGKKDRPYKAAKAEESEKVSSAFAAFSIRLLNEECFQTFK